MGAYRCDEAMPCASEASPKCITAGSSSASTSRCRLPQVRQAPPGDIHQQHPCSTRGLHQGKGESLQSSESAQTRLRGASGCRVQVPTTAHAQLPPAASQGWCRGRATSCNCAFASDPSGRLSLHSTQPHLTSWGSRQHLDDSCFAVLGWQGLCCLVPCVQS